MMFQPNEVPDFAPNSSSGQHLLTDTGIIAQAVELIPAESNCVEIGAGPGSITSYLLANQNHVTAYEVDERCKPYLDQLSAQGDLAVRWRNILEEPDEAINSIGNYNLVGNIPFNISEPLLRKMTGLFFSKAVLFVGERMSRAVTAAHPDERSWTRMSLISQAYFNTTIVTDVPRSAFIPPPRTDSALITQERKDAAGSKDNPLTNVYRALVEADNKNSTVAKALKGLVMDSHGNTAANQTQRRTGRSSRRSGKQVLRGYTNDYNAGSGSHLTEREAQLAPYDTVLSLVTSKLEDATLSKPLKGLSNDELRRLCGTIGSIINRRKGRSVRP